jgi:hypothetical protein
VREEESFSRYSTAPSPNHEQELTADGQTGLKRGELNRVGNLKDFLESTKPTSRTLDGFVTVYQSKGRARSYNSLLGTLLTRHKMFGLIISGRPVDPTPQAITESQFAFRISPAQPFSHIVVFLLPGTQLPEGTAASVYVQIPPSQEFRFLGGVGPGKESAIFKVSGIKNAGSNDLDGDAMTDDAGQPSADIHHTVPAGADIVVGVSIEPAAQVEAQMTALKESANMPSTALVRQNSSTGGRVTTKVLAQRIIGNAFNFLSSFGSDTVPLKAFQDWWTKFERKVELDPSFLEREQQG